MKLYAGFVDGKMDVRWIDDMWGGMNKRLAPAIFRIKREARQQYQDVRTIEIKEAPKVRRRKR
jgi:hypothetical protein